MGGFKSIKSSPLLLGAFIFAVGGVMFLAASKVDWASLKALGAFTKNEAHKYDKNISKDSEEVFRGEDALFSYVKKFGPKATIKHLHELASTYGDCHQSAHEAGRFSYEVYGNKSFQLCSAECHSGCYHGATEAYFKENGTAKLVKNLKTLCSSELNPFFSHQCIHGVGHGLMAWTSYELFEALESCDLLPERKDSCWTGAFMENIVGGLAKGDAEKSSDPDAAAHFTKYLSQDPLYPCNDPKLGEQYRGSCYFLQTSRMLQLFPGDFKKVAENCAKVPGTLQRTCFESMGRDVGGVHRGNYEAEFKACSYAPKGTMRVGCLIGAVQDSFWDSSGQDEAIGFCKALTDKEEKTSCYDILFVRAPDILAKNDLGAFCKKAEAEYQSLCMQRIAR